MAVERLLIETLKKKIRHQNKNYEQLAEYLKVSLPTIKKMFSSKGNKKNNISLERLGKCCDFLQITFFDLVKMAKEENAFVQKYFTQQQEEILTSNDNIFYLFFMLMNNHSAQDAKIKLKLNDNELDNYLLKLDKIKLIELHPEQKIKIMVPPNILWIPDGALRSYYATALSKKFFKAKFNSESEYIRILRGHFSEKKLKTLFSKLDIVVNEISDSREMISSKDDDEDDRTREDKQEMTFLLASRPFSLTDILKSD
ncbi:MAG: helix-turn-helix transcriptional regulator [Oligoflexia bacterium]|nr:helix-turn-helix transcriptional regulator [Oligoflexia bacterium]